MKKYLIVNEKADGCRSESIVEADSPEQAMLIDFHNEDLNKNNEEEFVSTVGIYEISYLNLVEGILKAQSKSSTKTNVNISSNDTNEPDFWDTAKHYKSMGIARSRSIILGASIQTREDMEKHYQSIDLTQPAKSFNPLIMITDPDERKLYKDLYNMEVDELLMDTPLTLYKGLSRIVGEKVLITTTHYEVVVSDPSKMKDYVVAVNEPGERSDKNEFELVLKFAELVENLLQIQKEYNGW